MGVSGSGKTTVGAALAQRLGVPFADADDFHPDGQHRQDVGRHPAGRRRTAGPGSRPSPQWLAEHAATGGVASCSALKRAYRDILTSAAPDTFFLHLHGDRDVLAARVAARPAHFMPAALID